MTKVQKDFFKTKEGKYYGLPHYEGVYGLTYDADLFDEQSWYFDADGNPISEEEARIRHLYDADENIVATFQHRNQAVVQAKYRHEEKALQLEVHTEYRRRR